MLILERDMRCLEHFGDPPLAIFSLPAMSCGALRPRTGQMFRLIRGGWFLAGFGGVNYSVEEGCLF